MAGYRNQGLYKRIIDRQGQLERKREPHDASTDEIVELYRPDLISGKVGQQNVGGFDHPDIIEGTAPHALLTWQRGFMGNMMSRRDVWFRQKMIEPPADTGVTFKGVDEVNQYLQNLGDHMTAIYRRSNYYDVSPEFIRDGGSVGYPVMLREYDPLQDRYIFKVPPYQARWLDKDIFGYDNVLHVKWRWNAVQALEFFGEDQLPASVKLQLNNGKHYEETEYIQAIYGAGDPIYRSMPDGEGVALTRPWMEHFVCTSARQNEQKVLMPRNAGPGYFERPFSSWHYHRNWHEVYSRTMAHFAIYDVRGANAHFQAVFGEAEVSLRPPTWAMRAMRGILDLAPGGENFARNQQEYENPPTFLERTSRYDVGIDFAKELQNSIKRWFHVDLFMQITQMILTKQQPETAYGLMRAEAEKQGQLAPQVETYETQVLGDTHNGLLDAEMNREPAYPWGALPEPPEIVQAFSDGGMDVEFIGPLSQAQIRDRQVLNFYRNLGVAEAVAGFSPEAMHKIKWAQALERVLEAGNFPQGDLRSEDEYAALIDGMQQRAIQQEIAENAPKLTQAIKNLQGATDKGSPLKALTGDAA